MNQPLLFNGPEAQAILAQEREEVAHMLWVHTVDYDDEITVDLYRSKETALHRARSLAQRYEDDYTVVSERGDENAYAWDIDGPGEFITMTVEAKPLE